MAKKPQPKSAIDRASAIAHLPEGLGDLIVAASVAAITTARAAAEADGKPGDSDASAAAVAAAELLVKANDAIDDWFVQYVTARLSGADAEAERQLVAKRATLKTLLEEIDTKAQALTARRAQVDADLEALKNTPAATEENGGDGDLAIPPSPPAAFEVPEGMELITVIGPASGLRRAGHLFDAVPNAVLVTAEQKALIMADPALSLVDMQTAIDGQFEVNKRDRLVASAFTFDEHGLTAVKVLGPKTGRRRIGHSFGPEESIVRVDREQIEQLLGDDLLAVGQA